MEDKLPTLEELNGETTTDKLPTLDELNGVAKKKYIHARFIEWWRSNSGKPIGIRNPFYFTDKEK